MIEEISFDMGESNGTPSRSSEFLYLIEQKGFHYDPFSCYVRVDSSEMARVIRNHLYVPVKSLKTPELERKRLELISLARDFK